jgi:hypothetical protein
VVEDDFEEGREAGILRASGAVAIQPSRPEP